MSALRRGLVLTPLRVRIEQGPVGVFADVVGASDPIYRSTASAHAAGYSDIPAPPTYAFAMAYWGAHPDLQPADRGDRVDLASVSKELGADGGLVLHGEQEFRYHRALVVGETVDVTAVVADVTEKQRADGREMRIATIHTEVRGASGDLALTETTTLICLR